MDTPEGITAALCLIAAARHSKDARDQQNIAACFNDMCMGGFDEVVLDGALYDHLSSMLKLDPTKLPNAPDGPKRR